MNCPRARFPVHFLERIRIVSRLTVSSGLTRDASLGPVGAKSMAAHLNARGVRARDSGRWGNWAIHKLLTLMTMSDGVALGNPRRRP